MNLINATLAKHCSIVQSSMAPARSFTKIECTKVPGKTTKHMDMSDGLDLSESPPKEARGRVRSSTPRIYVTPGPVHHPLLPVGEPDPLRAI